MSVQSNASRNSLMRGASQLAVLSLVAGIPTQALADSLCQTNPFTNALDCYDATTGQAFSVTGTLSPVATLQSAFDGMRYMNISLEDIDLTATGWIGTSDQFDYPVLLISFGNVRYDGSNATVFSGGGSNVALRIRAGDSLELWSGSVTNLGAFAYGVAVDAGQVIVHGGQTSVANSSVGIYAQSNYGDVTIYTGNIDASQFDATGAYAFAKDWGDGYGCGSSNVIVDGTVVANGFGVRSTGCSNGEVNVLAGGSIIASGVKAAIQTELGGVSDVRVAGSVTALDPLSLAIDQNAASSSTRIQSGGSVSGRYDGTDGTDTVAIDQGGSWMVFGSNDFGEGQDRLDNAGLLSLAADTEMVDLEVLENSGTIALGDRALKLGTATITNTGKIASAEGASIQAGVLQNRGNIDLSNGLANGHLLIDGDFDGQAGSALGLDIGPDQADVLSITGAVTGSTAVNFTILPGTPKLLRSVMFADVAYGDSESFVFGSAVGATSPLIAYHIDRLAEGYYLSSSLSDRAAIPISIGALERSAWLQSSVRPADADASEFRGDWSIWASTSGTSNVQGNVVPLTSAGRDLYFQGRQTISQGGVQFGARKQIGENGWHLAATAGYAVGRGKYEARYDDNQARSFNLSAFVGFRPIGPGAYGTLQIGRQSLKARFRDESFAQINGEPKIGSTGATIELGYRDAFRDLGIDLSAAVSVRRLSATHFETDGIQFSIPRQSAWTARAGARLSFGGNLNPFVGITANVEGGSRYAVRASLEGVTDTFSSSRKGKWLGIVGGLSPAIANGFSLTVGADLGDYRGGNMAVTYRY